MTKSNPVSVVDDLLNTMPLPNKRRNAVADNQELAQAVEHFLDLKNAGDERAAGISLKWFYTTHLRDRFNGPKSFDTVRTYVREFLNRDPGTGAHLQAERKASS